MSRNALKLPTANPEVKEIVRQWLKEHGYDGLYSTAYDEDGCGCELDDLFPCDGGSFSLCSLPCCRAGYRAKNEEGFWTTVPEKPAE
jgi:hypothetical protein